jgi:hypothetical protein
MSDFDEWDLDDVADVGDEEDKGEFSDEAEWDGLVDGWSDEDELAEDLMWEWS